MIQPLSVPLAAGPEAHRISLFLEAANAGRNIRRITEGLPELGPGDDAAGFKIPEGHTAVASSDASVEGVHFRREWMTWETIGYRAAAAALSDLAAMAAEPVGLLVSIALPPESEPSALSSLGTGVGAAAASVGACVMGGDLTASPGPVFLDVTVIGHAACPVSRRGARPGDDVWVTGHLGGAAAGVKAFLAGEDPNPRVRRRVENPQPRVRAALLLAEAIPVRAAIDVSDGLLRDARHLAAASEVGVTLDWRSVPVSRGLIDVAEPASRARFALTGGEDYELLFVVQGGASPAQMKELESKTECQLTHIGRVEVGFGVRIEGLPAGVPTDGFDHFSS